MKKLISNLTTEGAKMVLIGLGILIVILLVSLA